MSFLAQDGSVNVTVVDGSDYVGAIASNGSLNVVVEPSNIYGATHPSGAWNVADVTGNETMSRRSPEGWMNVTTDSILSGAMRITVVGGSLGGGPVDPGQSLDFSNEIKSYYVVLLDDPF